MGRRRKRKWVMWLGVNAPVIVHVKAMAILLTGILLSVSTWIGFNLMADNSIQNKISGLQESVERLERSDEITKPAETRVQFRKSMDALSKLNNTRRDLDDLKSKGEPALWVSGFIVAFGVFCFALKLMLDVYAAKHTYR